MDTTQKSYLKLELKEICEHRNIPTSYDVTDISVWWFLKEKGILQVLYNRGMIDVSKVKNTRSMHYTKEGK